MQVEIRQRLKERKLEERKIIFWGNFMSICSNHDNWHETDGTLKDLTEENLMRVYLQYLRYLTSDMKSPRSGDINKLLKHLDTKEQEEGRCY